MPDLKKTLQDEIRRLARKEVKAQVSEAKRQTTRHRREITGLRRHIERLQKQINALKKKVASQQEETADSNGLEGVRFSARSVRAQRRRTGLSAEEYGALLGVSSQTIYLWEHGKSRPRESQLKKLVEIRGIGKREARQRLEAAENSNGRH